MSAPAAIAPTTSWPSAPILKTLARKQIDSPTAMVSSGATFMPTSAQPLRSLMGSRKNTRRLATGSFPTAMNSATPHSAVSDTASSGESQAIRTDGCARRSSLTIGHLRCTPQAAHPAAHQIEGRLPRGQGRRHAPLRHHDEAIRNAEQFIEFLGNQQDGTAGVAQGDQLGTYLGGGAHIHAPGGLGHQQD